MSNWEIPWDFSKYNWTNRSIHTAIPKAFFFHFTVNIFIRFPFSISAGNLSIKPVWIWLNTIYDIIYSLSFVILGRILDSFYVFMQTHQINVLGKPVVPYMWWLAFFWVIFHLLVEYIALQYVMTNFVNYQIPYGTSFLYQIYHLFPRKVPRRPRGQSN